jgi:hypothetical protein
MVPRTIAWVAGIVSGAEPGSSSGGAQAPGAGFTPLPAGPSFAALTSTAALSAAGKPHQLGLAAATNVP